MAQKKKEQLREFLRKRLDSGETNGLEWINKEEHTFKLPWKHQNDSDWEDSDAKLFREWGNHKGRGSQEPIKDADLKATFRSGLKKTRYVDVLKEGDQLRYKICKLIYSDEEGDKTVSGAKLRRRNDTHQDREIPTEVTRVSNMPSPAESNLPTTLQEITPPSSLESAEASLMRDLEKLINGDKEIKMPSVDPDDVEKLLQSFGSPQAEEMSGVDEYGAYLGVENDWAQSPGVLALPSDVADIQQARAYQEQATALQPKALLPPSEMPSDFSTEHYEKMSFGRFKGPDDKVQLDFSDIFLVIKHRGSVLNKRHIACRRGVRISYLKPNEQDLYQDLEADVVTPTLPDFTVGENVYMTRARGLLDAMRYGLYLYADDEGNIHAVRISKLRIFYANTIIRGIPAIPEKLPKNDDVIVFDCEVFRQAFNNWLAGNGPRPGVRVLFSFGEKWDIASPLNKCHISAVIASATLLWQMQVHLRLTERIKEMEISNSSSWNSPLPSAVNDVSAEIERMSFEESTQQEEL